MTNIAEPEKKPAPSPPQKRSGKARKQHRSITTVGKWKSKSYCGTNRKQRRKPASDAEEVTGDTIEIKTPAGTEETAAAEETVAAEETAEETAAEADATDAETASAVSKEAEEPVVAEGAEKMAEEVISVAENAEEQKKDGKKANRPHNLGLVVPSFWKKPGEKFVAFTFAQNGFAGKSDTPRWPII